MTFTNPRSYTVAPGNNWRLIYFHLSKPPPTYTHLSLLLPLSVCYNHTLSPFLYTHTDSHFSQYGGVFGSSGASSGGQSSQVWTQGEQVCCCQQRLINTPAAIRDGLHVHVIILKALCQQTLLRTYNLPPMRKVFSAYKGSLRLLNKLVPQFTTRGCIHPSGCVSVCIRWVWCIDCYSDYWL